MLQYQCEVCGKEFSSETEFNEHDLYEKQKELFQQSADGSRRLIDVLSTVCGELRIMNLLTIMRMKKVNHTEAGLLHRQYWIEAIDALKDQPSQ